MKPRLIISDIDGCITGEGSVPVDSKSFRLIQEYCAKSHQQPEDFPPLMLCTGRPQPYVEALMKVLGIEKPGICENGAIIYYLEKNWAKYGPGVTPKKMEGLRKVRSFIEREIIPLHENLFYQVGKEAQLSIFCEDPALLRDVAPNVDRFAEEHCDLKLDIKPSHFYLNISLPGVTKGTAIRAVLSEMGLRKEEVIGIGDTTGDLPIQEEVNWFACPSNSQEGLKKVADYISPYAEAEGFLDILNRVNNP